MAYQELIRHFSRVRAYMQHFYVYGFYTREEFANGSARSYDDERRRVEGWLGEHMGFRQTPQGKSVFLSFDSRSVRRNPLYRALKSKSFTDRDITLHFLLMDALADGRALTVPELMQVICDERLSRAETPMLFDLSTLRGKVNEYEVLGLLRSHTQGNRKYFARTETADLAALAPMLAFFSEAAPCGVVGSYLEDWLETPCEAFRMKHHYIAQTLDSDLLCQLLDAMQQRCDVTVWHMGKDGRDASQQTLLPVCILQSVQDGRSYLAGWDRLSQAFQCCRLDRISRVRAGQAAEDFERRRREFAAVRAHSWAVSNPCDALRHMAFTIRVLPYEKHVVRRLYRECRCGRVEDLGDGQYRFSAEVYHPMELLPWLRTFIGRITSFECDSEQVVQSFREDLAALERLYAEEAQD